MLGGRVSRNHEILFKNTVVNYDVIVIGVGGVGSAAIYQLALRGARVLGIEQFGVAHDRGSSHGHTRVIRQAYFEHPDYVPLLTTAYQLWRDLERETANTLFHRVGLLEVGPAGGVLIPGVLESSRQHNLAVDQLTTSDFSGRFPGFRLPDDAEAVFEANAGYLMVEDCISAHIQEAVKLGAELRTHTAVRSWQAEADCVSVVCDTERFTAGKLVLATGAWVVPLLDQLGVPLRVLTKHLYWYGNDDPAYRADRGCPVFFYEMSRGCFYGFPQLDLRGVKIAEHTGGTELSDPSQLPREVDVEDRRRAASFLCQALPGVSRRPTDHASCMYTMSPDEHFILDRHPQFADVAFAAGLSGHGFKFAPVLGRALAELTLDGETTLPIDFLSIDRLSV